MKTSKKKFLVAVQVEPHFAFHSGFPRFINARDRNYQLATNLLNRNFLLDWETRDMSKPAFKPKPGQVDYTHARWAPVINCVVKYRGKILIVQRSKELHFYPGYWNGISGFLDDRRTLEEKVRDELREEAGIPERAIRRIRLGKIFHQDAPKYGKIWIVHPVLVEVKADKVKLDWEAEEYRWVTEQEARQFNLLPGFDRVLAHIARLRTHPS